MLKALRYLHLLGLALFLGSIPGHIVLGHFEPGGPIPPQGVMFARVVVEKITLFVTLPGCLLAVATGFAMQAAARLDWKRTGWLSLHLAIGLLVAANSLFELTPDVLELARLAKADVEGTLDPAAWATAKRREDIAGTLNLLSILFTAGLAVFKPRRRRLAA